MANHIPNELLLDVFKFTDGRDLRLLRKVSRKWNQIFLRQENHLALVKFIKPCEINDWIFTSILTGPIDLYKNVIFNYLRITVLNDNIFFNEQLQVIYN